MKTSKKNQRALAAGIILIASLLFSAPTAQAQSVEESIKNVYSAFDTARTSAKMAGSAAQFRLIAAQNPDNWLANYYAAYTIAMLTFDEKDKKKAESELDEAEGYFQKIASLSSSNQEVNILGALLASARITAKPSSYKRNGEIRDKYLETAKAINPDNPRIYYLQGMALYYTPKMFGGGPKKAMPLFEKAATLYATEQKSDITKPYWGEYQNTYMLSQCKEQLK